MNKLIRFSMMGASGNSIFVTIARHFRTEGGSLCAINDRLSTKITKRVREKWIAGGALIAGCLLISACASQPPIKESKEFSAGIILRTEDQNAWQSSLQLIKQQKWPEAKLALQNLIKTNPQFTGALINLAAVNCELHQWQEAAGVLNRLPETQKSPRVFNLLGLVAEHSGQITQAEQYYLAADANAAAPPEAHYNLALLYDIYWQDPLKALPFYENYARARPEDKTVGDWIIEIKRKAKR